ncbi:MAG: protein BatD [Flavobacteriaceae bacterium]|nr:protein BatD [Flavobacteriaceae bacterium]
MKLIKNILLFVIILSTSILTAQVTFEAKVSKKKLGINERLRIDFVMNRDGDNFNPPSFEHFSVIGPNQSISNSWLNGVKSYSKTYSYFLTPKKRGKFTITQATIEIDGETYKTLPVKIEVTSAVDKPTNPNDPNYIVSENIDLVAEISKTNPYLNEAITVVYRLYVSPNVRLSNLRVLDNPRYNDFWSQNIAIKELKLQNATYKGEDYHYVLVRKIVLYPQKTGKLNLAPLALNISVEVPTNRRDFFGNRILETVQKTITTAKKTITVKPLPENGKPDNFTGAVGKFNFKVSTSKSELKATEALQANIEVTGKGNLKLFKLPRLTLPSSLEVYEPEHTENVSTNLSGMQGKISDSYTIVPSFQGKYPIPSISFSFFDLETKSYKTITSNELVLNVTDGPTNSNLSSKGTSVSANSKKQIVLSNEQFLSFKTKPNLVPISHKHFFKTKLFWSVLLMPFLAIPIAIFIRKKKGERDRDVIGMKVRRANKLARKYLSEAKKALGNKESFYNALERALHNYLKAKLNIETSEFSKDKIKELLLKKSINENTIIEFNNLLKSCELARYTPFSNVEMQQDYDKAVSVISTIDKQIR